MPVTITINGENAAQAIEEFATLSASFIPGSAQAPVNATVEDPKQRQRRSATAKEPEEKSINVDKIVKEIEEEAAAATQDDDIPTVVDLRAKAQEVGQDAKKKPKIKALLDKYGSPNVSEVPEDKRAAFLADLESL